MEGGRCGKSLFSHHVISNASLYLPFPVGEGWKCKWRGRGEEVVWVEGSFELGLWLTWVGI